MILTLTTNRLYMLQCVKEITLLAYTFSILSKELLQTNKLNQLKLKTSEKYFCENLKFYPKYVANHWHSVFLVCAVQHKSCLISSIQFKPKFENIKAKKISSNRVIRSKLCKIKWEKNTASNIWNRMLHRVFVVLAHRFQHSMAICECVYE